MRPCRGRVDLWARRGSRWTTVPGDHLVREWRGSSTVNIDITGTGVHVNDLNIACSGVAGYLASVSEEEREGHSPRLSKTGPDLDSVKRAIQAALTEVQGPVSCLLDLRTIIRPLRPSVLVRFHMS